MEKHFKKLFEIIHALEERHTVDSHYMTDYDPLTLALYHLCACRNLVQRCSKTPVRGKSKGEPKAVVKA